MTQSVLGLDGGWPGLHAEPWVLAADGGWPGLLAEPWLLVVAMVGIATLVAAAVAVHRVRRRRRGELFTRILDGLEPLLVTPTGMPGGARDPDRAEDVRQAGSDVRDALAELERVSRFETSAAAAALRQHTAELADTLEARLRGERDPHLLEVRITELRERVRGARDRLDAAIGS